MKVVFKVVMQVDVVGGKIVIARWREFGNTQQQQTMIQKLIEMEESMQVAMAFTYDNLMTRLEIRVVTMRENGN